MVQDVKCRTSLLKGSKVNYTIEFSYFMFAFIPYVNNFFLLFKKRKNLVVLLAI